MRKRMHQHAVAMDRVGQHILINHQFPSPPQFRLAAHVWVLLKKIYGVQDAVDNTHSSFLIIACDVVINSFELAQRPVR